MYGGNLNHIAISEHSTTCHSLFDSGEKEREKDPAPKEDTWKLWSSESLIMTGAYPASEGLECHMQSWIGGPGKTWATSFKLSSATWLWCQLSTASACGPSRHQSSPRAHCGSMEVRLMALGAPIYSVAAANLMMPLWLGRDSSNDL